MINKMGVFLVATAFTVGIVIGGLGGALYVTSSVSRYEADAITHVVADSTASMVPILVAINEENVDKQIALIESAARSQLIAGIVTLHAGLPVVSDEKRDAVTGVLQSIAANRQKLKVGRFDEPPRDHIEEILAAYEK